MATANEGGGEGARAEFPDTGRALALQRAWTSSWHDEGALGAAAQGEFEQILEQEHRANFELWHAEDMARSPRADDAEVARVKRAIDRANQRRNDLIEQMDVWLLRAAGTMRSEAPLHSETPGMMLDRMSILALKIFHTEEQAARESASEAHRRWNRERLVILEEQREDLAGALQELLAAIGRGERRFKVYRQMKMYNSPELNPQIYGALREAQGGAVEEGCRRK